MQQVCVLIIFYMDGMEWNWVGYQKLILAVISNMNWRKEKLKS